MSSEARREALFDLLAVKATEGLDQAETQQLDALLSEFPDVDGMDFELAAAQLDCYFAGNSVLEAMPASLKQKVLTAAPGSKPAQGLRLADASSPPWLKLYALAATLLLALLAVNWFEGRPSDSGAGSNVVAGLDGASDLIDIPWVAKGIEGFEDVAGRVRWSTSLQRGEMKLEGLPTNDPTSMQYQLWVIDKERDAQHPVDGGVFDIEEDGTVVIPIDAKLALIKPAAFAITAEKPGGIVVSDGPHLAVAVVD